MKKKAILIGWDAADWEIINPLLQQGKLPALAGLIKDGVHGNLSTMNPPYSPMLWSSVATGKTPDKHGVLGFIELDTEKQQVRPVTVTQRKVRALWNILHNKGLKSNLVGWWPSHPAEPINGVVVSDQFPKVTGENGPGWKVPTGSVHPESLREELNDLRMHPSEITEAHILPFIPNAREIDQEKDGGLKPLSKMIAHNTSLHACSTWLMENTEWDFMGVYYDMIDHFCHSYMKFYPPKLPVVPQDLYDMYNGAIEGAYRFQDMMLERTLELAGEDALVIVMSDHGFVSDEHRMIKRSKMRASPALDHREFGIFVAKGPGIKKGQKIFGTSLLDIAPTLLDYFGLPIGEDMDGMVMKDIFSESSETKYIPSWEDVQGDFGMHQSAMISDPLSEQMAMEQLIELGYVDRPDENIEKAIHLTRCDIQFNLARVYMGKQEFDKAEKILLELIEEDVNIDFYLIDLIQLMIMQKEFKRAGEYLNQLRRKDLSSIKKTRFTEAKIMLGLGRVSEARVILEELQKNTNLTGIANYDLGKLLMVTGEYESALEQFKKAIAFSSNRAKYHHGIAVCYMRLNQPEMALEHSLESIELVRYFPDAHVTLGQALEELGDLENAKKAFSTAEKLGVKNVRAKIARENIEHEQLNPDNTMVINSDLKEIIIVSGLPRSGTSLMMQMLDAVELPILTDGLREKDNDNPKGYFEYEKVKSLYKINDWLDEAEGKVVKIIAHLLKFLPTNYRYKVIFMTRDIDEVLESQKIMLNNHNQQPKRGVKNAFQKELERLEVWYKKEPGVEVLKVPYHEAVDNPTIQAQRVAEFLGRDLDTNRMAEAVDAKLYRNRIFKLKI